MVSDRGGKYGYVARARQRVYNALRRSGHTMKESAQIANAGITRAGRSAMARAAARTRKRRGGH